MQGNLSDQSPADVLSKVQGLQASGVLRVENGKTIRQLFIDAGSVIRFAASNLPVESLTSLLKQKAGVTDDHLRRATAAKRQNELLGTALVRLDVLESGRLAELTQEHVGHVMRAILSLKEGRFRFQAGDLPFRDQVDGGRSIAAILLQWARDSVDPVQVRYRLGSMESCVRRAQTPPAGFENVPLDAAEGYALSRLDVPTSLRDLCTLSPVPEETTLRAIYALRLAGFVKIVAANEADRPAPADRRPPSHRPAIPRACRRASGPATRCRFHPGHPHGRCAGKRGREATRPGLRQSRSTGASRQKRRRRTPYHRHPLRRPLPLLRPYRPPQSHRIGSPGTVERPIPKHRSRTRAHRRSNGSGR